MGYYFAKQAPGDHHRLAMIIGQRALLYNRDTAQFAQHHPNGIRAGAY
jgi:hypothetical protein